MQNKYRKYEYIRKNSQKQGLNFLLKRFKINKNAYFFYFNNIAKNKQKQKYKQRILTEIREIYHKNNGTIGYRMMSL